MLNTNAVPDTPCSASTAVTNSPEATPAWRRDCTAPWAAASPPGTGRPTPSSAAGSPAPTPAAAPAPRRAGISLVGVHHGGRDRRALARTVVARVKHHGTDEVGPADLLEVEHEPLAVPVVLDVQRPVHGARGHVGQVRTSLPRSGHDGRRREPRRPVEDRLADPAQPRQVLRLQLAVPVGLGYLPRLLEVLRLVVDNFGRVDRREGAHVPHLGRRLLAQVEDHVAADDVAQVGARNQLLHLAAPAVGGEPVHLEVHRRDGQLLVEVAALDVDDLADVAVVHVVVLEVAHVEPRAQDEPDPALRVALRLLVGHGHERADGVVEQDGDPGVDVVALEGVVHQPADVPALHLLRGVAPRLEALGPVEQDGVAPAEHGAGEGEGEADGEDLVAVVGVAGLLHQLPDVQREVVEELGRRGGAVEQPLGPQRRRVAQAEGRLDALHRALPLDVDAHRPQVRASKVDGVVAPRFVPSGHVGDVGVEHLEAAFVWQPEVAVAPVRLQPVHQLRVEALRDVLQVLDGRAQLRHDLVEAHFDIGVQYLGHLVRCLNVLRRLANDRNLPNHFFAVERILCCDVLPCTLDSGDHVGGLATRVRDTSYPTVSQISTAPATSVALNGGDT
ncbi:RNA helicase [Babesia caballi]|uniref:RNA helicase n=1 Tax=Babesia caballi TaxID=5871 RepID=A0AAV4LR34_BABCB|nr:RNA helicase [Babesia caballi]